MERKLVARGVLAGLIAGLAAFLFARIFAEGPISRAIDYESARDAAQAALDKATGAAAEPEGHEIFSRAVQQNFGIGVGVVLFGAAMGALFAVCYTVSLGRVGAVRARSLSLLVAAAGFLGIYFVPFLKYPANPPSIGHPDTIKPRSGLYLLMVIASLILLVLAVWLGQRLRSRLGTWNASLVAVVAFIAAIAIVMLILPDFGHLGDNQQLYGNHTTETPAALTAPDGTIVFPGFPADTLFSFRLYSVGTQLLLWSVIGLVFAPMAGRLLDNGAHDQPVRAAVRV